MCFRYASKLALGAKTIGSRHTRARAWRQNCIVYAFVRTPGCPDIQYLAYYCQFVAVLVTIDAQAPWPITQPYSILVLTPPAMKNHWIRVLVMICWVIALAKFENDGSE